MHVDSQEMNRVHWISITIPFDQWWRLYSSNRCIWAIESCEWLCCYSASTWICRSIRVVSSATLI